MYRIIMLLIQCAFLSQQECYSMEYMPYHVLISLLDGCTCSFGEVVRAS